MFLRHETTSNKIKLVICTILCLAVIIICSILASGCASRKLPYWYRYNNNPCSYKKTY